MMELNQQTPINTFYGNADEAAENGDLHINIHPPARTTPAAAPLPTFQPTIPAAPQPITVTPTDDERIGAAELNNTDTPISKTTTTKVKDESHINWGGIVKGAAIVGAVVLVGVVGWWAAGSLASMALASPVVSSLAGSVSTVATPVIEAVTYGGHWLAGFIPTIPATVAGFASSLLGTGGAGLTLAGQASTIGAAQIAGAGTAVLVGAPVAAHAIAHTNLIDHTTVTHTNTDLHTSPDVQGHETNFLQDIFATKSSTLASTQALADHGAMHAAEHANATAIEQLGHHSAHHAHESGQHELADTVLDEQPKHNKWADRMGSRPLRPSMNNSFASSVLANKSNAPAIAPRGVSFSEALDNDRAKLDAALGEPTR